MASLITQDGKVVAPFNIAAPTPSLSLGGFHWDTVDEKINGLQSRIHQGLESGQKKVSSVLGGALKPQQHEAVASTFDQTASTSTQKAPDALEFPLTQFQGTFAGNGFNLIFRPRSNNDTSLPITPPGGQPDDSILELNLTTEQLTFGPTLGNIPNRGLGDQPDITLGGIPYIQTVQDVTNPATGKGDSPEPQSIHFEPGVWLNVPPAAFQNRKTGSVVRMASIPHGTTINAQGWIPSRVDSTALGGTAGPPQINDIDTTPFNMGDTSARHNNEFKAMDAEDPKSYRIPQNLDKFNSKGTKLITTEIIKNPNLVLKNAIAGLEIQETISFEVSTGSPTAELNGGGTANISFLAGLQSPVTTAAPGAKDNPIAHAEFMHSNWWIERVAYKVTVPQTARQVTLQLRPTMPANSTAPTPTFLVTTPPNGVAATKEINVPGIQIQSSQYVNLNFHGLAWPHVSVATYVPTNPQPFQMT